MECYSRPQIEGGLLQMITIRKIINKTNYYKYFPKEVRCSANSTNIYIYICVCVCVCVCVIGRYQRYKEYPKTAERVRKQSRYRPGVAQRVPGSYVSQIS
jgi:hypothetical protein